MPARWDETFASDGLAWAERGLRDFTASLRRPEFRDLYSKRSEGELVIAVFGKSQVGKTELILRLLGVRPDAEDLRLALRGGRAKGLSASVTAAIYRRCEGESYRLKTPQGDHSNLDLATLREHLRQLRNDVEAQTYARLEPIEFDLPSTVFDPHVVRVRPVTILDLPGVDSSEPREHAHVQRLLRRYLPGVTGTLIS